MWNFADMLNSVQLGAIGIMTLLLVAALLTVIVWFLGDAVEHVPLLLAQLAPLRIYQKEDVRRRRPG
jgi:hypothetical protein